MKKLYANFPVADVDLAVETLLLEMDYGGLVEIDAGSHIVLTELGKSEQKSVAARMELKQRKKAQRTDHRRRRLEIEQKKTVSKDMHERQKLQLSRLAFLLGKPWKQEHPLVKGGPVILDLVWYKSPHKTEISHAFEVQHRGEWKNAIGNLEAIKRYYPSCKLFLVVHNERQISPIRDLLGAQLNTSIKVLGVPQIRGWVDVLERVPEKIRPQLIDTIDDILHSGIV
jgi:hypothetical protein